TPCIARTARPLASLCAAGTSKHQGRWSLQEQFDRIVAAGAGKLDDVGRAQRPICTPSQRSPSPTCCRIWLAEQLPRAPARTLRRRRQRVPANGGSVAAAAFPGPRRPERARSDPLSGSSEREVRWDKAFCLWHGPRCLGTVGNGRRPCAASDAVRTDHLEGLVHMYIGLGTLIVILVVVAIIYFVRRA